MAHWLDPDFIWTILGWAMGIGYIFELSTNYLQLSKFLSLIWISWEELWQVNNPSICYGYMMANVEHVDIIDGRHQHVILSAADDNLNENHIHLLAGI